jgi:pimeloyl-ACP methyl ester carboxylesterase
MPRSLALSLVACATLLVAANVPTASATSPAVGMVAGSAGDVIADSAGQTTPSPAPLPKKIDLDAFDATRQYATLPNGIRMAYWDVGPRDAPAVLLIHGYTSNGRGWVQLLPYLDSSKRYLIPDLRGHGQTSKPDCCYDRFTFAYDLRLLLDALKIERADVYGTSLGSIIAQAFAEFSPQYTRRLVLQSSTGGSHPECTAGGGGEASFDFRAAIVQLKDPIDPNSKFMIDWYTSTAPVDEDFLRRMRNDAAGMPVHVWLTILEQGLGNRDLQAMLPRIQAPTLLVFGALDNLMGEKERCSLIKGLPKAQVKIFPNLGHNPYWEDPKAVAAVVNPFLKD